MERLGPRESGVPLSPYSSTRPSPGSTGRDTTHQAPSGRAYRCSLPGSPSMSRQSRVCRSTWKDIILVTLSFSFNRQLSQAKCCRVLRFPWRPERRQMKHLGRLCACPLLAEARHTCRGESLGHIPPPSVSGVVMLVAFCQLWWKFLYHENQQMQPIRPLSPEPAVSLCLHSTAAREGGTQVQITTDTPFRAFLVTSSCPPSMVPMPEVLLRLPLGRGQDNIYD